MHLRVFSTTIILSLFILGVGTDISSAQRPLFNESIPRLLQLDQEQLAVREQLRRQFYQDRPSNVTDMERLEKDLTKQFVASLNQDQLKLYDNYCNYSKAGNEISLELIQRAPFRTELQLSADQKRRLTEIRELLDKAAERNQEELTSERAAELREVRSQFLDLLDPGQKEVVEKHLGSRVDVGTIFASEMGMLRYLAQDNDIKFTSSHFSALNFLAAFAAKTVDPPVHSIPMTGILSNKDIAKELKLSRSQREKLHEIEESVKQHLKSFANVTFSMDGEDFRSDKEQIELNYNLLFADDEKRLEQFQEILTKDQFQRATEIYRQVCVTAGAPGLMIEFNPNWDTFLGLEEDQKRIFQDIQLNYLKFEREAPKEMLQRNKELRKRSFDEAYQLLNAQQQQMMVEKYGPFMPAPASESDQPND